MLSCSSKDNHYTASQCSMGELRGALLLAVLLVGAVLCCQPPDCDTPDCGSCAQACCELDFYFNVDFEKTYASVVGSLQKGGADTRYSFVNSTDYRQNNIQVKYQLQGVHRTLVHHYNDTINMLVISDNPTTSRIRAFSISQIEGAYCDQGQNFKNLIGFFKGLEPDTMNYTDMKVIWGCTATPP